MGVGDYDDHVETLTIAHGIRSVVASFPDSASIGDTNASPSPVSLFSPAAGSVGDPPHSPAANEYGQNEARARRPAIVHAPKS